MKTKISLLTSAFFLTLLTTNAQARVNLVNTGLSLSYDFEDRQYEDINTNRDLSDTVSGNNDEEYQSIALTPQIRFISTGIKDRFEVLASPSIKYDLLNYETDWDNNLFLAAERSMNKNWRLIGSNTLLRTDYYESTTSSDSQTTQNSTPELSADFGRTRYWQNTLNLTTEHLYGQQSLLDFGFNYVLLRNDESDDQTYEDYDRYEGSITNEHRFTPDWSSIVNLSVIRGDFENTGLVSSLSEEELLSEDLMEYRFRLTGKNNYSRQTTISLTYDYIGSRYDEDLQVDGDIHQAQLRWLHNYSRQTTITLGAGPSYEKSEGQDSNIGGNGIAEIIYQGQRGSLTLGVEKIYDVDNFSGTNERGFVDTWETRLLADYQLLAALTIDGQLRYTYEDRNDLSVLLDDSLSTNNSNNLALDEYHVDTFIAGVGLRYDFLENYTTSLAYTFLKQESDILGDDYDDHRVILSLSWQQDLLRWN